MHFANGGRKRMRELKQRFTLVGLLLLAGCNSTDALTPQVDVGGGTMRSPPVTQRDLDQMSAESRPVGNAQATAMAGSPAESRQTGGSGTLEAQADALSRSQQNPVASGAGGIVIDDPGPQQSLAAQQSAPGQNGQGHSPQEQNTPGQTARGQANPGQPQPSTQQTETAALAPAAGGDSIRFLPIIGAPVEAVTPLSRQLGAQARASGLTIKSSSDNSSRYILKGYFSAMQDGGRTNVVYVWDVLDSTGARLHRIQGQNSVNATAKDPWAAVPAATMEAIAQRTIQEYVSWKSQSGG